MTDDERKFEDDFQGEDEEEDKQKGRRVRIVRNEDADTVDINTGNETVEEAADQAKKVADRVAEGSRERVDEATEDARETIKKSVDSIDKNLIELLSGFLDTETRSKVYLCLRKRGEATSEEIAEDTGLYPSTVRECLSDLYQEGVVERRKKQTQGAGNNPYVYTAVPPSELAKRFSERVEERLNRLFNLDSYLLGDQEEKREIKTDWSPYKIVIDTGEDEEDETPR